MYTQSSQTLPWIWRKKNHLGCHLIGSRSQSLSIYSHPQTGFVFGYVGVWASAYWQHSQQWLDKLICGCGSGCKYVRDEFLGASCHIRVYVCVHAARSSMWTCANSTFSLVLGTISLYHNMMIIIIIIILYHNNDDTTDLKNPMMEVYIRDNVPEKGVEDARNRWN